MTESIGLIHDYNDKPINHAVRLYNVSIFLSLPIKYH